MMNALNTSILAKSSSGDSYDVQFLSDGTNVRVFCHCAAGVLQQVCKHKVALLKGDKTMLFDAAQVATLKEIHSWPGFAALQTALRQYESDLAALENEKAVVIKREKDLKARFGRQLTFGKP